jgi:hypothetical protein
MLLQRPRNKVPGTRQGSAEKARLAYRDDL